MNAHASQRITRFSRMAIMRTLILVILLTGTLATGPTQAQENIASGNYMLPLCKSWLRMFSRDYAMIKNEISIGTTKPGGVPMYFIEAGMCAGIVIGISEGLVQACIPKDVNNEQLVRVVVASLEKHPEHMHEDFSIWAGASLIAAWPCPKQ